MQLSLIRVLFLLLVSPSFLIPRQHKQHKQKEQYELVNGVGVLLLLVNFIFFNKKKHNMDEAENKTGVSPAGDVQRITSN